MTDEKLLAAFQREPPTEASYAGLLKFTNELLARANAPLICQIWETIATDERVLSFGKWEKVYGVK